MDKILKFVSVFCSANLSCFMIFHIFKDKHKVAGDIASLNLLVFHDFVLFTDFSLLNLSKTTTKNNHLRTSNSLDPDQAQLFCGAWSESKLLVEVFIRG